MPERRRQSGSRLFTASVVVVTAGCLLLANNKSESDAFLATSAVQVVDDIQTFENTRGMRAGDVAMSGITLKSASAPRGALVGSFSLFAGAGLLAAAALKRRQRGAVAAKAVQTAVVRGTFPARETPLLDALQDDLSGIKELSMDQLEELADEVRWQVLDAVSVTGGHLSAGLGVVDLTIALHYVFDTPSDELIWDVAHQVYPHKVLTGRAKRMYTNRQKDGLSGFAKRTESQYDAFGAGHSSTSISAAVGFQTAREYEGRKGHSVAVIGDGAITAGMAWEAINHAGFLNSKMMVILNDNGQVSLPTFYNDVTRPFGALSRTLAATGVDTSTAGLEAQGRIARFETSDSFQTARNFARDMSQRYLSGSAATAAAKIEEYVTDFVKTVPFDGSGSGAQPALFEELGFRYVGPIDGHDIPTLVEVLTNLKREHEEGVIEKPVFLHIKTVKGKGYGPAERALDTQHMVLPGFNLPKPAVSAPKRATFTQVMVDQLVKDAHKDDKIVAITAAMPDGTGMSTFHKEFGTSRTFDVGIAEQHAVTFAAGLAAGGLKPFCALYSSFLQRGYDQLVHDVALQKLPVRFVVDRAGLVGADGPTHGGTFDLSFLCCIPNLRICAPADEVELVHMMHTLAKLDDLPSVIRFPRGTAYGKEELPAEAHFLEPGKGRIVRKGNEGKLVILSLGGRLHECLKAAAELETHGISATVADARWAKPLDSELVQRLAREHGAMLTIEENAIGGFGSMVQQELFEAGCLDAGACKLRSMTLPDRFIDHGLPEQQYDDAELNSRHIVEKAMSILSDQNGANVFIPNLASVAA